MTAPRSLTDTDRRSLLVERQLLGPAGRRDRSVSDVVGRLGLLHATDPSTPYLSLHARCDATPAEIDDELYVERSLVRQTTIRRTVFVMPHDVAAFAHGAANAPIVAKLRAQLCTWLAAADEVPGDPRAFLADVEVAVVDHLRVAGATTGHALAAAVPALQVTVDPMPGASYSKPIRITSKVLEILAAERRIARARPSGADLTSGAWTWAAYDDWFGAPPGEVAEEPALDGLLSTYLASFAPATVTDIAWWTGLTKTKVRASLERLGANAVELESTEPGFAQRGDRLGADAEETRSGEPVVALLPGLDATTMGWKQRGWYVDDDVGVGLFDRNGNAGPTVWVDGVVVGGWTQRGDGEVVLELLRDVGSDARALLDAEADRTQRWLGDVRVNWRYPTAITKRLEA